MSPHVRGSLDSDRCRSSVKRQLWDQMLTEVRARVARVDRGEDVVPDRWLRCLPALARPDPR